MFDREASPDACDAPTALAGAGALPAAPAPPLPRGAREDRPAPKPRAAAHRAAGRAPSDRALQSYLRELAPFPTLTRGEEVAFAKTIDARASEVRRGVLGIPLAARFVVERWRERRREGRVTAALGAVSARYRGKHAGARIDRVLGRVAALLARRDALEPRRGSRPEAARRRIDAAAQGLLLEADLSPALLGEALRALRQRRAALRHSRGPRRRAAERELGLPLPEFLDRMGEIDGSERALQDARNRFLEHNLKLVVAVARDFRGLGIPFTDLIQEGNLGLIHAVEKFDHHRGFKFSTYACWWIRQSMIRSIQNHSRMIRLPSNLYDKMFHFRKRFAQLSVELGQQVAVKELGLELGRGERETERLVELSKTPASLDAPVAGAEERSIGETIPDPASPSPIEAIHGLRLRGELRVLLARLRPRERQVLRWRFGLAGQRDHTLEEIGGRLGLSRERVRQIEFAAIARLRKLAEERGFFETHPAGGG